MLFALLLPVFLGLGAIVVSIGNLYVHQKHLQTQVDAAAFAAATKFSGCFADQNAANTAIRAQALAYAGDMNRHASTTNLQVQEPADVHVVLNSHRFWEPGDAVDDAALSTTLDNSIVVPGDPSPPPTDPSDPCETRFLDVKGTDFDLPSLFPWMPAAPDAKKLARVEIRKVKALSGMLPFAVPEVDPGAVAAIFVDEDATAGAEVVRAAELNHQPDPGPELSRFNTYRALIGGIGISSRDNIGVVVLVSRFDIPDPALPNPGGSLAAACSQTGVRCYAGSAKNNGIALIHGYSTGSVTPRLGRVDLGGCTDAASLRNLSAPYFSLWGDCPISATAEIDFGGVTNPQVRLHASASCTGSGELMTSANGTIWTGGTTLPDPSTSTGQVAYTISWKKGPDGGCFEGGTVARPYLANGRSGPIEHMSLRGFDKAGNRLPSGYSVPKEPLIQPLAFEVTVGLRPPLEQATLNDEPALIRFASEDDPSLTQSIDCDIDSYKYPEPFDSMPGGKDAAEIAYGCVTPYAVNPTLNCSGYSNGDLPPDPAPSLEDAADCAQSKNGQVSSLRHGLAARFENPCTPNNWPEAPITPEKIQTLVDTFDTDPRLVTLIVTEFGAFDGGGARIVPIKYFAGFYVTGWDVSNTTDGCYGPGSPPEVDSPWNDPHPIYGSAYLSQNNKLHLDNGDVWGYFVTPVIPAPAGSASDELCAFDGLGTCLAVLVQ